MLVIAKTTANVQIDMLTHFTNDLVQSHAIQLILVIFGQNTLMMCD